jgi:zinc protease
MRGKRTEDLEAALLRQLDRLKKEPVSEDELEKAKNQIETTFVFSQDSLFFQAMLLARYEIATGWEEIRSYIPMIRKITARDIQRVAATYFVPENRTVAVLHPNDRAGEPLSRSGSDLSADVLHGDVDATQ